ncbi:SRPBCC family protein (plasmid) [Embleya sp. NBC_00888]|uniref:SRPBCC family protein n=1 Tax=Embleya sp. NBC_00888 TaxID=2975960 RepID=UPI002F9187ED|nr:SRPBCC family protein [Embleya sp. NBC_00888]
MTGRTRDDGAAGFSGSFSAFVPAPADAVFALVTDVARLPEWNRAVTRVLEAPEVPAPGAEWVVVVKPDGWPSWPSRSRVLELDPQRGVFGYRAQSDDGNPSYADWRWHIVPEAGGARLTVTWELHPQTFWRKHLFARLRRRRLSKTEVPASVAALTRVLSAP